jgi:abelson tyrosine-protein kinase 1
LNGYVDGTLRWHAPERMSGQSRLTTQMDVYAFAICCIEILSMGRMPWQRIRDDETVRGLVLSAFLLPLPLFLSHLTCRLPAQDSRPTPHRHYSRFANSDVQELLRSCWHRDPTLRPPFSKITALFVKHEISFNGIT